MGPYGSVWADIKTGKSPMAQDHFQTPPDPKRGYKNLKKSKKIQNPEPRWALAAIHPWWGYWLLIMLWRAQVLIQYGSRNSTMQLLPICAATLVNIFQTSPKAVKAAQ